MQHDRFSVERFPSLEQYRSDAADKPVNVLIATEEIIGPVRNGGIASTYYHLARGLARQGHKVTVLYLKGRRVENETPEHWITHYKEFGIDLVYLEAPIPRLYASSQRWQSTYYSFYEWLKANDRFDVIHTSEWRGGAFYCLQAKRLGLAFRNSLFIVKTSSPHIWNRHYQMQPIDEPDLVTAAYAEQKCVEWADMVVGGSAHLLSFMRHIGYTLPQGRCYVQPNIIDFSEVKVTDLRRPLAFGDVMTSREIVFFGRLEPRKGLELFCNAVNALVAKGVQIDKINFLGKEGERLLTQGGIKPLDFIEKSARNWPFPIEIVTDKNQPEALSYMCSREMIAVMPSLIENSTMAVYEALVHYIPFIATSVGGTPELVDERDHKLSLIPPSVDALATQMARALNEGQPIARPAFDNARNLETWYGFHRYIGESGTSALLPPSIDDHLDQDVALIAYPRGPEDALAMVKRLQSSESAEFAEVVLCLSFLMRPDQREALQAAAGPMIHLFDCIGLSSGEAFNAARHKTRKPILVFDAVGHAAYAKRFVTDVNLALASKPQSLLTAAFWFDADFHGSTDTLFLPMGGDMASQYLDNAAFGAEIIAMKADSFDEIGAFETYHLDAGIVHEYVTRAMRKGHDYFVIPEAGFTYVSATHPLADRNPHYEYLKLKTELDAVGLDAKKVWLYHLGKGARNGQKTKQSLTIMNKANREDDGIAWLINADKPARLPDDLPKKGNLFVGFDKRSSILSVAVWGAGDMHVFVNDQLIRERPGVGAADRVLVEPVEVLPLFENTDRLRIKFEFITPKNVRARTIALQKLDDGIYFIGSKNLVYFDDDFMRALDHCDEIVMPKVKSEKPKASANKGSGNKGQTSKKPVGESPPTSEPAAALTTEAVVTVAPAPVTSPDPAMNPDNWVDRLKKAFRGK